MGRYSGKTCRLLTMLVLTAIFFLVEIIVGYVTNSIALVADSFHMLSDLVALIVGFSSVRIAKWPTKRNTFGWIRAEVLGAMVNSVFLLALCFSILVEALKRLVTVEKVEDPKLLLIVGVAGLLVNLIGLCLFHEHGHSHGGHSHGSHEEVVHVNGESEALVNGIKPKISSESAVYSDDIENGTASKKVASSSQLNMRGVFLHVLGDALGSVIVIISALVIWFVEGDWKYYVDPAMSIAMVIIILASTIPLFRESAFILMQTVPAHIHMEHLKQKLEKVEGVSAVHEFHVWQLAGSRIIASAHVRCRNPQEYTLIATKIKELFHNEGIHSTTIQPEFEEPSVVTATGNGISRTALCNFECGPNKTCYKDTCCGTTPSSNALRYIQSKQSMPLLIDQGPVLNSNERSAGGSESNLADLKRKAEDRSAVSQDASVPSSLHMSMVHISREALPPLETEDLSEYSKTETVSSDSQSAEAPSLVLNEKLECV